MNNKKVLITGVAGFIGFHLAKKLIEKKYQIIGIDNLNNYYDKTLKLDRLKIIKKIKFYKIDIINYKKLKYLFKKHKPDIVLHLAAQAGVRYSLKYPKKYINVNIKGFFNVLELSKIFNVEHFLFASSSSVYGKNKQTPFKENHDTSSQTNIYGVTKKTNEVMAHSFSHLFNMKCTALRFFTVYGPWGRPDMSIFLFVKNIINGKPISVFNKGLMSRDFTYIDDAINYTVSILEQSQLNKKNEVPFKIFNISNGKPIKLMHLINLLGKTINKKIKIKFINNLKTEIKKTEGSPNKIFKFIRKKKSTSINQGIKRFIKWYCKYYKIK